MDATEGLVRGMEVVDTGTQLLFPLVQKLLEEFLNVIGEPVDDGKPIKSKNHTPYIVLLQNMLINLLNQKY